MNKLSKLVYAFTHIGVQEKFNYNQSRFLQFTNITALALMLLGISGFFILIKELTYSNNVNVVQAIVSTSIVIASTGIIYLNHLRYYTYAKSLLIITPILSVIILSMALQQESGINFYYILTPIGLLLFLGLNVYSYLLISIMYIVMLLTIFYQNNYGALSPMVDSALSFNYAISLSNAFLVVFLLTFYLIRTNQNMEKKLVTLLETDALTGLYNRHKYSEFSESHYKRAIEDAHDISVIIFDLDFFKSYNDTYGHLEGDVALKSVATVLKNNIQRKADLIARFGGEEFVAILTNTSMEDALQLSNKILQEIQDLNIKSTASLHTVVTCSAGIATITPQSNSKYIDLFIQADTNLYKAKNHGRNQAIASKINV